MIKIELFGKKFGTWMWKQFWEFFMSSTPHNPRIMIKHTLYSFSFFLSIFHVVQGLTCPTLKFKKSNRFISGSNKHLNGFKTYQQSTLFQKQNDDIGRIFEIESVRTSTRLNSSKNVDNSNKEGGGIWNPELRKIMGTLSAIGMLETAYLTFIKMTSMEPILCSSQGSCGDVLNGPYASVGDIPLAAFGLLGKFNHLSAINRLGKKKCTFFE